VSDFRRNILPRENRRGTLEYTDRCHISPCLEDIRDFLHVCTCRVVSYTCRVSVSVIGLWTKSTLLLLQHTLPLAQHDLLRYHYWLFTRCSISYSASIIWNSLPKDILLCGGFFVAVSAENTLLLLPHRLCIVDHFCRSIYCNSNPVAVLLWERGPPV